MTSKKTSAKKKAASAPDERIFRLMFEEHSAVMLLIEPQTGEILDANQAAADFYGYAKSELCGMKIQEINTLAPEQVAAERQKALVEERNYFIFPHRLASGKERIVEVHSSPIVLQEKQILFSIIHDITERRQAEDHSLLQNSILNAVANAIMLTDRDSVITWVNPAFSALTGYTLEESINKNPRELVKSGKQDLAFYKKMWETILSGEVWQGEIINRHKSGSRYTEEMTITPLKDADGVINHFIAIKQDVTARKQADEQLRESEEKYRTFIEQSSECITLVNEEGNIIEWNHAREELTGLKREEVLGKPYWDIRLQLSPPEMRTTDVLQRFKSVTLEMLQTGQSPLINRIHKGELVTASGERKIVDQIAFPVKTKNGYCIGSVLSDITARKRAEEVLRASEEKYRLSEVDLQEAQAVAHIGSWKWNLKTAEIFWSDEMYRIFGIDKNSYTGRLGDVISKAIHPDDLHLVLPANASEFAEKKPIEYRIIMVDKSIRTIWAKSGEVILDDEGNSIFLTGIAQDITERKQADQALIVSEAKLRALVEQAPTTVYTESAEAQETLYISPQIEKLTGYTSAEWVKDHNLWKKIIHPADVDAIIEINDRTRLTHEPFSVDYRILTRDGRTRWIRDEAVSIKNQAGTAVFWQGVMHDITERKQAEDALRESEEKFRNLFNNSEVGMFRVRLDGSEVLEFNEKYLKILNYTLEELKGLPSVDLWADKLERERLLELLNTEGHVTDFECRMLSKQGDVRRCIMSVRLYGDTGILEGSIQDITERKQAEEELRVTLAKYKTLFEHFPLGITIADGAGNILESNPVAEKLLSVPLDEQSQRDIDGPEWRIIHQNGTPMLPEEFASVQALKEKRVIRNMEMGILKPDNSVTWLSVTAAPLPMEGDGVVITYGDITEQKQAEENIYQRVNELETINRISLVLRSVSKQNEMLSIVLSEALAILNTPHGSIELYNRTTDSLEKTIARGWTAQVAELPHKIDKGIADKVFTSGNSYISREFASDPETRSASRKQIPAGWGGVCLPIRTSEQTLGVMIVSVPSERELDKDEIRLLSILSEMTGAALQRMQLHEQTTHRLEQLNALRIVDHAISSSRDMHLTLNVLLTNTISQLNVDAADVLLLHSGSNLLELAAGYGFHTLLFESVNLSDSFAGRAILEHRSIISINSETTALHENPQFLKFRKAEGFICYWCVPLVVKGEVKGALEVYQRNAFTPDAEWLEFLEALAGQAAITIDNTQLFENLQRSNLDLSHAYDATIEGWSRAMDLRDHDTEGHTQRVTDLTLKLARALRVSESQLTAIRRGALLHDIGKMGVPDSILLKEGKLTDEEWVLMRKHPQLARDMLMSIAYLKDSLDVPYCHHEKWDGTGYPQGLAGENIPLVARIFAIIDVWDALITDRPYRKKWTKQKARQYIKEQSGRHFDPQVVEVFLKTIGKG